MSPQRTLGSEQRAVLFADICGSTALYDSLGDDLARRLISQCLTLLCAELPAQQGVLIKTLGDEVMCTFPSAEQALAAACAMQRGMEKAQFEGGHPLMVRIGFHFGEVLCDAHDVHGDTVNVAARVAAITRATQIMTTLAVAKNLPMEKRASLRQVMRAEFKGKQERLDIFQVVWEQDDGESTRIGIPAFRKFPLQLEELTLTHAGKTLHVNQAARSVMMGRDKVCELAVSSDFASRQHVRIELRFDKFVLIDQSTNGTYVRSEHGEVSYVLREEIQLKGRGTISLGNPDFAYLNELVEYAIHATKSQNLAE
ncbi:MAG: adenylate/guanylate cyclase domain-containing protein [Sideroxydans sp.]|nr:adenylate/guanylate cyclase domain-containing protein [Sideroxydans sp.]